MVKLEELELLNQMIEEHFLFSNLFIILIFLNLNV